MALAFQRRLAMPLWAVALFMVALPAAPSGTLLLMPPTTAFAIAVGIAAIIFLLPGANPWSRTSHALVRVRPSGPRPFRSWGLGASADEAGLVDRLDADVNRSL